MAKIRYDSKGRVLPQGITEVGPDKYKVRFMYHGEKFSETVEGLSKAKRTLEDLKFKGRRKLVEKNKQTLNEWFEVCLELKKISRSSKKLYEVAWNKWIRETVGKKKPEEVSRLELQKFFIGLTKDLGADRIGLLYSLLNDTLEEALRDNPFKKNPVTGILKNIELRKTENPRQKALKEEEQNRFIEYVNAVDDVYKELYVVLFYTGLRISEAVALMENNIDFDKGIIKIEWALKRDVDGGMYLGEPKRGSKRIIPMLPSVKNALKNRMEYLRQTGLRCKKDERLLFFSARGNYIQSTTLIQHTNGLVKKMSADKEFRKFTNHAMRHSFATRLKECDTQEDYIALVLGHKNIETTRKSYVDLDVDEEKIKLKILKAEIDKIDKKGNN